MKPAAFFVPTGIGDFELVEKKSRFIGQICQVHTEEEAKAHLQRVRKTYHDGRHHCWCYILNQQSLRYSDDGEPQGTAGQPMLNFLQMEKIQEVSLVVTRYFGGTLLGTGGLVRAYTHCAKGALAQAGRSVYEILTEMQIITPYSHLETVQKVMKEAGGMEVSTEFAVDVSLCYHVENPKKTMEIIQEKTAGQVLIEITGEVSKLVPFTGADLEG